MRVEMSYHGDKLKKIYNKLPTIDCKKLCHTSCGLIAVGKQERKIAEKIMGKDPYPTLEEARERLRIATENKEKEPFRCSLLKEGKCSIYNIRPLICRIWGLTKKLRCPYGCIPSRWLEDTEAKEMLTKAAYYD